MSISLITIHMWITVDNSHVFWNILLKIKNQKLKSNHSVCQIYNSAWIYQIFGWKSLINERENVKAIIINKVLLIIFNSIRLDPDSSGWSDLKLCLMLFFTVYTLQFAVHSIFNIGKCLFALLPDIIQNIEH